ncbi:MAG: hypothetical protein M1834_005507 [Cirrosporium novae-zelandiae]|nr:MAG: hypothetical protein M1834_005507 [Cirrosporium novae-zelandiae]
MSATERGIPDTEMFLQKPGPVDSPTIEPLKISKRDSASSETRTASAGSQPYGAAQPSAFPLPPGATSSATPLPYPDDRSRVQQQQQQQQSATNGLPYPQSGRIASPDQRGATSPRVQHSYSPPPKSSPASATDPSTYPAPLQIRGGRDGQQHTSKLAERRGAAVKPLPDSPGPETPDKEGLSQRIPQRNPASPDPRRPSQAEINPYPEYHQQYWPSQSGPKPLKSPPAQRLNMADPNSVNRMDSVASVSTTKAQRGSPPPPETPVAGPDDQHGGGIEARYAAAGIAGTSTLNSLQAHNAAATQRAHQYAGQQQQQQQPRPQAQEPARRPWTPTEQPGSQPHGPPTVYQGPNQVATSPPIQSPTPGRQIIPQTNSASPRPGETALEHDFQRMNMSSSPPPAYSSVSRPSGQGPTTAQGYPDEKRQNSNNAAGVAPSGSLVARQQGHPAFANDPGQQSSPSTQQNQQSHPEGASQHSNTSPAPPSQVPASPPPLPEGWIAHLDPNSGQYYYIHLPTQSTQWEFPKGPTPLNLNEAPISPTQSAYGGHPLASPGLSSAFAAKPMASPGFAPPTPGYAESVFSMNPGTPTMAGFSGIAAPPPSNGVEVYKVAPTNGVYFGPYLRYTNMDLERGLWLGSILLVTDAPQPPTIHIHQSADLSPNPRQLKAIAIHVHQRWTFYKYEVDLQMEDQPSTKWTYAITSHLGCTRYEFLVAGRNETGWRWIATSGNDFSINVNANERAKLGGVGYMWKDIMQKHVECGGFHAQLGLGGQIYADRLWREIPLLKQWLSTSGKDIRKNTPWTAQHEDDVTHAYFHYYTSHFDQPYLREAFAQIPHILTVDDHDIFDGFGSYPDYMQFSNMFKNIGRIGIEMYLLFQHHTTLEILRNVSNDTDLFTVTGTGWHFVKYLGPAVVLVGPDTRSERNPHQVMAGPTYQGLFPKIALLPPSVQHCLILSPVPIVYPRLEAAESIAHTITTGKKAVTGAYNILGRVTSSVAGVVGAKSAVNSSFDSIKRAVGKSGLMNNILSPFGDIDVLDELRDQWTHESKDLERTYLIRTLQGIAHQKALRITFLSGAVNACATGLLHDPSHPQDHKTMYQLIASAVVNTPPPSYVLKLLTQNSNKGGLYVPLNAHRSQPGVPSDTKEDMLEIFKGANELLGGLPPSSSSHPGGGGGSGASPKIMGRRNYVAMCAYDPEVVTSTFGRTDMSRGGGKLSLAADFVVQGDQGAGFASGMGMGVVKFGPVVVPGLEFGR